MLQIVGIIGECEKDINMLAYLKTKTQKILLHTAESQVYTNENESDTSTQTEIEQYDPITDVKELELLIVSSEIDINKPHALIDKAKKHNIQIMSNIDAIYMFKKPKTIAITGSYSVRIVSQMISHVLSKCGVDHYMSLSETFKWPENLDATEYIVIALQNYQLKSLDLFYANVTCVTNVKAEKTEGKHIQEYISNIKHVLELSNHKVINTDSDSIDLLKYFDDALTAETEVTEEMIARYAELDYTTRANYETVVEWQANPLKMKLALLTATVLQSIAHDMSDGEYMFIRALNALQKFKLNGRMQIIFQNDDLIVIDDHKAHTADQVIYDMNFFKEDTHVVLMCPEPKDVNDWLKLKHKNYISRIHALVLYDAIVSELMSKMEFSTRVINGMSFDKACAHLVTMFNKTKKRPIVIMYVNGTAEYAETFNKVIEEFTTEEEYEEEEYDETFID